MILEFLEEAEQEFIDAVLWYESQEKDLGTRFRDEVEEVLEHIIESPKLWRERPEGHRRVNCPVFPYFVAYFIRNEKILIAAVAHERRKPDYWTERITGH